MIKLYIIAILIIIINKDKLQMKYSAAKGVVYMDFRVLEKYIETCKIFSKEPSWYGLKLFRLAFKR